MALDQGGESLERFEINRSLTPSNGCQSHESDAFVVVRAAPTPLTQELAQLYNKPVQKRFLSREYWRSYC